MDFIERKGIPRTRAIILVFFVATTLFVGLLATVVPRLIFETGALIERVPAYSKRAQERFQNSYIGQKLEQAWKANLPATNVVTLKTNEVSATNNVPAVRDKTVAKSKPARS